MWWIFTWSLRKEFEAIRWNNSNLTKAFFWLFLDSSYLKKPHIKTATGSRWIRKAVFTTENHLCTSHLKIIRVQLHTSQTDSGRTCYIHQLFSSHWTYNEHGLEYLTCFHEYLAGLACDHNLELTMEFMEFHCFCRLWEKSWWWVLSELFLAPDAHFFVGHLNLKRGVFFTIGSFPSEHGQNTS